ncbi:PDZ domain-containing protein [Thalassotalea euphylliae]|uniref:PDZ domain-containing protein n=1 Tax=Thalassotalea euphylliae TaxID=1655234 RepID=A0A3E0U580_9GAMM|nr:PDZ domain-containing protein [Thalassotalea euphylliae]REL31703.1 PDZ domain-containing protein [Thalassotalea euphylliae]
MKYLATVLLLVAANSYANELKSAQAQQIADQLVRTINQKLAEITALEVAEGVPIKDIKVNLSQGMRFDSGRFGAILDASQPGRVVSVTPRSQASQLGIQSGDIIVSINDMPFDDGVVGAARKLQYLPNGSLVKVEVKRGDKMLSLQTHLKAKYLPQWQLMSAESLGSGANKNSSHLPYWQLEENAPIFASRLEQHSDITASQGNCGRIILVNSLSISPSKYSGLKNTSEIKEIDGHPWMKDSSRVRVDVGLHRLKVGNKYDTPRDFRDFSLYVAPNTNYYIAYTHNKAWVDDWGTDLALGKYTGPVIWKTTEQACEK